MVSSYLVIVTGSDPECRKGGISFALPAYLQAMESAGITCRSVATYNSDKFSGKWWWLLKSIPILLHQFISSRLKKQKIIVYSHPGAGISLLREGLVLILAKAFGAKTMVQIHALQITRYLDNNIQRMALRFLFGFTDKIGVLTPWWETLFCNFLDSKYISVIPDPMPLEWENKARQPDSTDEEILHNKIFTMARLEPGKGVDLVIEAMSYLPENYKLTIAGTGSEIKVLENKIKELNLSGRICLCGWVAGPEKQVLLDKADIFCLPSSNDSFGMVFIEAMANGLPVVALDWGPISEVVPNMTAGILIRNPDARELASAIRSISAKDIRKELGEGGKRWVLENFTMEKVGKDLLEVFEGLVK